MTTDGTATVGEALVHTMSVHGFRPSPVRSTHYVEFLKDYADGSGRLARAVVQFDRAGGHLAGFSVTVQAFVAADERTVAERAPPIMQGDLLALVQAFENGIPKSAVILKRCSTCATPVSEFFVLSGKTVCRTCKEKMGANGHTPND